MTSGHTLSTKNVFDDYLDILPLVKDCNKDKSKCLCTDPSYIYPNRCKINTINSNNTNHSGRSHCTYGTPKTAGYENAVSGNLKNADKYDYTVGTTSGRSNFNQKDTGLNSQPKSLLFCSDPTGTGALPTLTKSQIDPGTDGTINSGEWNTTSQGTESQTNLGFDR